MPEFDAAYFAENYPDYAAQNPPRKLLHYHQTIQRRVDRNDVDLLDVGCGMGTWAGFVASKEPSWRVTGLDVDPDVIARNAARFPSVEFRSGRAGEGTQGGPFDVITAMDVLEHVPDVEQQFKQLRSWSAPGGMMVFVVPVYDGPLGPVVRILDKDPTHIHKWSRDRWLRLAQDSLVDIEWHGLLRYLLPGGFYVHVASSALRWVSPAILVSGRWSQPGDVSE
jgi:SAM-dependent methyltransferase